MDKVWKELGPIDVLVNNAGIETLSRFSNSPTSSGPGSPTSTCGANGCARRRYCRRAVAEKRPGSIVNIGSVQAGAYLPGRTHYAPTKLGLEALTRNVSAEMGPNIRVNCIHPGLIDTDMVAWVMKRPDLLPGVLAKISLARPGQPREIGTVAAFFASDEASYITGQSLYVDGGWAGK